MIVAASEFAPLSFEALTLARRWCALPSVKGNERELRRMAGNIADWMREELGADLLQQSFDASPPIVHARLDAGRPITVILYNMYDVMPAAHDGWHCDPFAGDVIELDGIGPALVARGAENNKGPLAGMLVAIKALSERNALPVNVEIVIEGEEESGSRALRAYLQAGDCPLRYAASALFPSLCEYGGGPPRLYLGFSGIAKGVLAVEAGTWGAPERPIHSSNAPWIANPASRLAEAVGHLAKAPTGQITTIALDPQAQALIARLAESFDAAAELQFRATRTFAVAGSDAERLATLLSTASLNLAWLATEPVHGDGVIPSSAAAGIEVRTPPGLDPEELLTELAQKLGDAGMDGARLDMGEVSPGYRFRYEAAGVGELLDIYTQHGRPAQVWPWAPGSAPASSFSRFSEAFLIGGLGRGGNAHDANEFMAVDSIDRFLGSVIGWLSAMSGGNDFSSYTESAKEDGVI